MHARHRRGRRGNGDSAVSKPAPRALAAAAAVAAVAAVAVVVAVAAESQRMRRVSECARERTVHCECCGDKQVREWDCGPGRVVGRGPQSATRQRMDRGGGGGGGVRRRGGDGQRTLEQNGAVGIILATARVTFASEQNVPRGVYFGVKRPLDPLKLREI